jgi:choline dehydrogenase-like flavoprotein
VGFSVGEKGLVNAFPVSNKRRNIGHKRIAVCSGNYNNRQISGFASHEVGTVRMGNDPKASALNAYCQSREVRIYS